MAYTHLASRREGGVEYLTLNRPQVRNALNDEVFSELLTWAEHTASDPAVRVVVLAGAGPVFSGGADIGWMAKTIEYTEEANVRDAEAMSRTLGRINTLPAVVIGRVQGAALGGGAGLAAVCDVVVADESAVFGFTEVKLGIIPAVISPFVIAKIGQSAARELFLTGMRFSAQRAREIGLVHAVKPAAAVDEAIAGYVREALEAGPEAIRAAKELIAEVSLRRADELPALTARAIAGRRVSSEGQEGLRSFLTKRPPSWRT